jgi:hypothetical protein
MPDLKRGVGDRFAIGVDDQELEPRRQARVSLADVLTNQLP